MAHVTYFVAMPFSRNEDGELVVGEAKSGRRPTPRRTRQGKWQGPRPAPLPFSRTGDPTTGDFDDAVVLREFGDVPSLEELHGAE